MLKSVQKNIMKKIIKKSKGGFWGVCQKVSYTFGAIQHVISGGENMLRICLIINAIIPIVYVTIYWDVITKRKEMSVSSKKILVIGVAVGIIALLVKIISIYCS